LSDIRLVGPDTASADSGVAAYFPEMLADPVVMAKVQHFGFHNYGDYSANADTVLKSSAYPDRDFWVTEAGFGTDYYGPERLIAQMRNGAASAGVWDAYTSQYNHRVNDGAPMIDRNADGTFTPKKSYYAFKQLFKFTDAGATRIGATPTVNLVAVAFHHSTSGQVTVIGHNQGGGRQIKVSFANLPAFGALQYYQTSASRNFERMPDVTLSSGVATITVDGDGYFTLTATAAGTADTQAPIVSMLTPAPGAVLSGTNVTLSANASDNVGVAGVQFKVDGVNIGPEVTTSPYSISWNTTTAANGAHTLSAVARDIAGNSATSAQVSVTVSNIVDTTPPTVSMSAPLNGATVSGAAVTVSANASDANGVVGVQFFLDGAPLGAEDLASPYSMAWNTIGVSNGVHTLRAVARDGAGNNATSATISITVNNVVDSTPPTVSVTAPLNGATVAGTAVVISATATDPGGVAGVEFLIDGSPVAAEDTTSPYSVSWNSLSVPNGTYSVTARARDTAGNVATSAARSIVVNNIIDTAPPTISITAPLNNASVAGIVTISANATDDAAVVGVQFFLDGAPLGAELATGPYSITWDSSTVSAGAHTITAKARDAGARETLSSPVNVTVTSGASSGTLAIDALVWGEQAIKTNTTVPVAFSTTSPNELILAFISADDDFGPGNRVTSISGAGLTWELVVRANSSRGMSEIWRAFAPTPLTNASVTAILAQNTTSLTTIVSFTGVDTFGANGVGAIGATQSKSGTPATGAVSASVTTTRNNSWVFGVGNDWTGADPRTVGTGQTLIREYLPWNGATYWIQRRTTTTPTAGTVVPINITAPTNREYNLAVVEILPRP